MIYNFKDKIMERAVCEAEAELKQISKEDSKACRNHQGNSRYNSWFYRAPLQRLKNLLNAVSINSACLPTPGFQRAILIVIASEITSDHRPLYQDRIWAFTLTQLPLIAVCRSALAAWAHWTTPHSTRCVMSFLATMQRTLSTLVTLPSVRVTVLGLQYLAASTPARQLIPPPSSRTFRFRQSSRFLIR